MKTPLFILLALLISPALQAKISIVAAENFYGGIAQFVAGSEAQVTSILNNPNQDPHEFQTDAATAQAVAVADIVIYSGIGYDPWMEKLLGVDGQPDRTVIDVSNLIGAKPGDNPHIWYDPRTMPALVAKLAQLLNKPDAVPAFAKAIQPLTEKITTLKPRTTGVKVTATEPVFGYLATALGFEMLNIDYQQAAANNTEPSFQEIADFEQSLSGHEARILFYNSQVTDPSTERLQSLARDHGIPVVGVTETQPPNAPNYVAWMVSQLDAVEDAMGAGH